MESHSIAQRLAGLSSSAIPRLIHPISVSCKKTYTMKHWKSGKVLQFRRIWC